MLLKLLYTTIMLLCAWDVRTQDVHFIYIQTELNEPFYVKLNNQVISSSAGDYLIVPKLPAAVYSVTVGSIFGSFEAFSFQADVKESDAGYIIKTGEERRWYLVNLVTSEPVQIEKQVLQGNGDKMVKAGDEFARMLAEVVNEPSLNIMRLLSDAAPGAEQGLGKPSVADTKKAVPGIKRMEDKKTDEGYFSVYMDENDTVHVFIPAVITPIPAALLQKPDSANGNELKPDTLKYLHGYNGAQQKWTYLQLLIAKVMYRSSATNVVLFTNKCSHLAKRFGVNQMDMPLTSAYRAGINIYNPTAGGLYQGIGIGQKSNGVNFLNKTIFNG